MVGRPAGQEREYVVCFGQFNSIVVSGERARAHRERGRLGEHPLGLLVPVKCGLRFGSVRKANRKLAGTPAR